MTISVQSPSTFL